VRPHRPEQVGEPRQVVVPVVKVVDDADVRLFELVDDRDLILGFAEPPAVVVQRDLAAVLRRLVDHRGECRRDRRHLRRLRLVGGRVRPHHPQLGADVVLGDDAEQRLGVRAEVGREPHRRQLDSVRLQQPDLAVERRQVFGPPVVGVLGKPELF
jgi:hypothetical protein